MSLGHRNVETGNDGLCFGKSRRRQVLLYRKMRKLDNWGTIQVDNGKQTGAGGQHGVFWIHRAPVGQKCGGCPSFEIECKKLGELLDMKWTRCSCDALEKSVRTFPFLVANIFQCACICL